MHSSVSVGIGAALSLIPHHKLHLLLSFSSSAFCVSSRLFVCRDVSAQPGDIRIIFTGPRQVLCTYLHTGCL